MLGRNIPSCAATVGSAFSISVEAKCNEDKRASRSQCRVLYTIRRRVQASERGQLVIEREVEIGKLALFTGVSQTGGSCVWSGSSLLQ